MVRSPSISRGVLHWRARRGTTLDTSLDRLAPLTRTHPPLHRYDIAHHYGNHPQFERQAKHGVVYVFANSVLVFVQLHATQREDACGAGQGRGWGCCELSHYSRHSGSDHERPFMVLVIRMSWMPA